MFNIKVEYFVLDSQNPKKSIIIQTRKLLFLKNYFCLLKDFKYQTS